MTPGVFSGALVGAGLFQSALKTGVSLSGDSPFTGILSAVDGGTLTMVGTAPAISGISILGSILLSTTSPHKLQLPDWARRLCR